MAKNMARIKDGVVTSVEWWADREPEHADLINIGEKPVTIGDEFDSETHTFWRDGEEVLSITEQKARAYDILMGGEEIE